MTTTTTTNASLDWVNDIVRHHSRDGIHKGKRVEVVGYMRTSSATNVGTERTARRGNGRQSRVMPRLPAL